MTMKIELVILKKSSSSEVQDSLTLVMVPPSDSYTGGETLLEEEMSGFGYYKS